MGTSKTLYSFGGVAPVASHVFNGKGDQIAISKNNKDVEVIQTMPLRFLTA